MNAPVRIQVPISQSTSELASTSTARLKRGRPIGSKDKNPRKRKELIERVGTSSIISTLEENLE